MYKYEFRGKKYTEQDIAGQAAEFDPTMSVKDYIEYLFSVTNDFKILDNPEPIVESLPSANISNYDALLERTGISPVTSQTDIDVANVRQAILGLDQFGQPLKKSVDDKDDSKPLEKVDDEVIKWDNYFKEKYENLSQNEILSRTYDMYGTLNPEVIKEFNERNGIKLFFETAEAKDKKLREQDERLGGTLNFLLTKKGATGFFRQDKEYSIEQLKTYFSDDYDIKLKDGRIDEPTLPGQRLVEGIIGGIVGDIYDADLVQIIHKKSGESIDVRLGIKPSTIGIDSEEYEEKESNFIEEQADKLYSFIGSTITTGEIKDASIVQEEMLGEYRKAYKDNLRVTTQRKNEIKKEVDGFSFEPFEKIARSTRSFAPSANFAVSQDTKNLTVQPYQAEMDQAKQMLVRKGNNNPTRDEIIEETKKILTKNLIDDEYAKNARNFYNSDDIEETDKLAIIKMGGFFSEEFDKETKKEIAITEYIRLQKTQDHIDKYGAQFPYGKKYNATEAFLEITGSPSPVVIENFHYDIYDIERSSSARMVRLPNGTEMPLEMYNKGKELVQDFDKSLTDIKNLTEDLGYLYEEINEEEKILDLTKRDYHDGRKFVATMSNQASSLVLKGAYGLAHLSQFIPTPENVTRQLFSLSTTGELAPVYDFTKETIDVQKQQQKVRSLYQEDVAFDDAFSSVDNFGRFLAQETANQVPVFAMIATGNVGIAALGLGSFQEQFTQMTQEDLMTGNDTSDFKKYLVSLGYGAAEVIFDRFLTFPVLNRASKLLGNAGQRSVVDNAVKGYWRAYSKRALVYDPLIETASEGLTTISQNLLAGRPITENLNHALFSGGLFGTTISHVPFYKGLIMSKFSDYNSTESIRTNLNEIEGLEQVKANLTSQLKRKGRNRDKKRNTQINESLQVRIESIDQQIQSLQQDNQTILRNLEDKLGTVSEKWFNDYNDIIVTQEKIRIKAKAIESDVTISSKQKNIELKLLKDQFDGLEAIRIDLQKDSNYGTEYGAFKNSTDQSDIDLKNELENKVKLEYNKRGKSEPDEKTLDNEVRILYNSKIINDDVKKFSGILKEGGTIAGVDVSSFENFQTVQEAIDYINNLEGLDDVSKQKTIKVLQEGGHGSTITLRDADGNVSSIVPFQVVENMAKDDRLQTRTHELGHAVFRVAFNGGDFNTIEIANKIQQYLLNKKSGAYASLLGRTAEGATKVKSAEEIIVNFFELVAEGRIDLKSPKNKGFAPFITNLFQSDVDMNVKGETDAINFLIGLAKKIKAGTITETDIKEIRKGNILKKIESTTKETAVDFSEAKAKQTLNVVQEEATVDGNFDKDKFNPNDNRIISQLQGMVNAQISNLSINQFLKNDGRAELQQQTLVELFSRGDIAKFNGKGTLYGFINGRIKFSIKDAFKNNPAIVEDFNKADLDETMKQLDTQEVDTAPLDDKIVDETIASDAKINVLALTNKESEVVSVVNAEGDYKAVIDNNVGNVGNKIFNIPGKKISDPKANITTSTKIVDPNTGKVISKKDLKAGKKGILSPSEAKNIQDFFSKISTVKKFIQILPKENVTKKDADINKLGENIDVSREVFGRGIGLPRRILEYFYQPKMENGKRVRSQGKTSQVPMWELKPEFTNLNDAQLTEVAKQFQKDLGITEGGLTNVLPTAANRSKIGQLLKGAALVMSQQASLSGAQRIKETQLKETKEADAKAKIKQEIADITTGQADVAFSAKANRDIARIVNKSRGSNVKYYSMNEGTMQDRMDAVDRYIDDIVNKLVPIFEKYPGLVGRSHFISDNIFGINDKDSPYKPVKYYAQEQLKKRAPLFSKKSKDGQYSKIKFSDKILNEKTDQELIDLGNKNVANFTLMWNIISEGLRKDVTLIEPLFHFFDVAQNETSHLNRLGAPLIAIDRTVKNWFFEHALQNVATYQLLLEKAAIENKSKFNETLTALKKNYNLIAISPQDNKKLTKAGYGNVMALDGNWNVFDNSWVERYANAEVAALGGINLDNLILVGSKQSLGDKFKINIDGSPRSTIVTSKDVKNSSKVQLMARTDYSKNPRGMSAFDFDETLIDKGENTIIAKKGDEVVEISSGDWPLLGPKYAAEGYDFDFSDFINVKGGVAGPLLQKLKNRIKKFGASNNYILTARPAESAPAIHAWLKTQGINIPLENITGLGNSTGEAKAMWILDKFAQGYNDIYFVDDALPNVKAVADVIDQLDIKGKSVQARVDFSKKLNNNFNKILEQTTGIGAQKRFSDAQAKLRGKGFKFTGVIPPSAQDFAGLLYSFLSPGRLGEKQFKFFKENLIDPFARGVNELNTSRQKSAEDYKNLLSKYPDVRKDLKKSLSKFEGYEGVKFTVDQAVRVYLWTKAGFDVPGLSARDLKLLTDFVKSDSELTAFADAVGLISKKERGYAEPNEYWLTENINSDLMSDGAIGEVRADFLADFINNKNEIFSPENMNKIEAAYGPKFREALEDILFRMETGRNMPRGGGRLMQEYTSWVNGSVGAIMFFNMRSALLQTISAVNYINWSDNNPLKAAAAFANQKQFWSDFVFLFNSDFLKQRRVGNRRGVNEAELSQAVAGKGPAEQAKAAIRYLLKIGFLPTQIADSFAIASGGASFYRNRVKSYLKQGMSQADAEAQAFLDFQETTEVSQQSARPDLISQQQANPLGRLILAFANTPMQYGRIIDKSFRDIVNNRGDFKTNTSKIIYYGAVQSIIFSALQTALFAVIGSEEEEKDELISNKLDRILNSTLDTFLTTFGYGGKAISTAKNTAMEYLKQRDKDVDDNFMTRSDHAYTLLQALSFSPPISSKARKIYQSIQTEKYNRDIIKERGFKLDNPVWSAFGNVIEGVTNIPLGRLSNKMLNVDNALDSRNETWQRLALIMGWNTWDLGIKDHDIEALDADIKERKKIKKEQEKIKEKYEKKKNKLMEKYPDLDEEQIDIKIQSEKYYPLRKYEQVELLKKLDLSDKEIKQLKKESDRAEKINELYKDNKELIDNYLTNSQNKTKEEKDKEQKALKPKKKKLTREESLYRLNKKQQLNILINLGLGQRSLYYLKSEKQRVDRILLLEDKSK